MPKVSRSCRATLNAMHKPRRRRVWPNSRYIVWECVFPRLPEATPANQVSPFSMRRRWASMGRYSVTFMRVTLLRPSTLMGTSPSIVARRTTRCWSP